MKNETAIEHALRTEIQRSPQGLTPEQQATAAKAAVPHFRVGNFSEAAQRGIEQTLFPGLTAAPPSRR